MAKSFADKVRAAGARGSLAQIAQARSQLDQIQAERPHGQTDGQAREQTHGQTDGRTDTRTDARTDTRADGRTDGQTDRRPSRLVVMRADRPMDRRADRPMEAPSGSRFFWMTPNTARVLAYLQACPGGLARLEQIAADTAVPYGSVRRALRALTAGGCITRPVKVQRGRWQGLSFQIIPAGVEGFTEADRRADRPMDRRADSRMDMRADGQTDGQAYGQTTLFSSSSKNTTTKTAAQILADPECRWWLEEGITPRQLEGWVTEFGCQLEELGRWLAYARCDLAERQDVEDKPAYFRGRVLKAGTYARPKGYRSIAEIRAEQAQAAAEAQAAAIEAEACARERARVLEIMGAPDSPRYRQVLERMAPVARKRPHGPVFEAEFRKALSAIEAEETTEF